MQSEVKSAEISVVLQGPINSEIDPISNNPISIEACNSVRKLLPECEVIVASWKGSHLSEQYSDKLLLLDDPGRLAIQNWPPAFINTNRMIVATRAGINAASRKYVLKGRTDQILTASGFLSKGGGKQGLNRLVCSSTFSSNPLRCGSKGFFSISDMWQFGEREKLLEWWNVPLVEDSISPSDLHPCFGWLHSAFVPEQYFGLINFLKLYPSSSPSLSKPEVQMCALEFVNKHWVILPMNKYAFRWPKRRIHLLSWANSYTSSECMRLASGLQPSGTLDSIFPNCVYWTYARLSTAAPGLTKRIKQLYHAAFWR